MPTKLIKNILIKTNDIEAKYHIGDKRFLLTIAQIDGLADGPMEIYLDEEIVRQMAEMLPPREPEFVN